MCSFTLLQSLVVPVLGGLQRELGTDQTTVTWVLTAYLLSASVCTPLLGRLGDVVGKKRMLVLALVTLSVGSLMAALSASVAWLIVARVVQGAGGGVLPLSFAIIRDQFRPTRPAARSASSHPWPPSGSDRRGAAGPIVAVLSYRWLFWLPMITTALAAVGAALVVPKSPLRAGGRIPLLPAAMLSGWLVSLLLGLSQGNRWGWGSPGVLGLFALALALVAGWIVTETRGPVPLIDMRMMRRRGVWTANLVAAFVGFGVYASFGFLPQLLQTPSTAGYGFGASLTESGRLLLPAAITSFPWGS